MDKFLLLHGGLKTLQQHLRDKSAFSTENLGTHSDTSWCQNCTYQAHTRGEHHPAYLDQGPRPEANHVLNVVIEAVGTLARQRQRSDWVCFLPPLFTSDPKLSLSLLFTLGENMSILIIEQQVMGFSGIEKNHLWQNRDGGV